MKALVKNLNPDMNILIIGPYPPPFGGISSLIRSLVDGFKSKEGKEVIILYFGNKNNIRTVDGAIVYEKSVSKNIWKILNPLNWYLVPILLETYYDRNLLFKDYMVILIKTILTNELAKKYSINTTSFYQSDTSLHLLLCKRIWRKKRSIILTVFGEIYDVSEFLLPKKGILLEMLYQADAVISSSCYCAESFKTIGNERDIEVIYVGVSVSRFQDGHLLRKTYRKDLGVEENTVVLLFMGRFNPEMGLQSILELIPSLLDSGLDFHFILAGAAGELTDKALACSNDFPEKVTVMNDIPFDLQPTLYAASDIVLSPSRDKHACMGVSIKEAMAAGVPVIASDSGGIPEAVIHNETGIIVPLQEDGENNLEVYKKAILNLSSDINKRKLLSDSSKKRASDMFSEETTIEKTFQVFKTHVPED